ncbi:MAG: hypothetical protein RLZZ383_1745 [Pseudomonadota bacterium]|jgi:hypothetical protein
MPIIVENFATWARLALFAVSVSGCASWTVPLSWEGAADVAAPDAASLVPPGGFQSLELPVAFSLGDVASDLEVDPGAVVMVRIVDAAVESLDGAPLDFLSQIELTATLGLDERTLASSYASAAGSRAELWSEDVDLLDVGRDAALHLRLNGAIPEVFPELLVSFGLEVGVEGDEALQPSRWFR